MPKIYLASDPLGSELRQALKAYLATKSDAKYTIEDLGNFDKYYEAAAKVGSLVQQSHAQGLQDRAVLTCGTGMGMSIIANKFPDVYAAVVESVAAAGNAASINNANVLTLGGMVFKAEDAIAAVDKWMSTGFTEGYEQYKELLDASMKEIPLLVPGASSSADKADAAAAVASQPPHPAVSIYVDGREPSGWRPIEAMGHESCLWCVLREDAAAACSGSSNGHTRVRALVRFPAGAQEPPHHHSNGHDVLVLAGDKSVTNHKTNSTVRLGPWSYLYTPAHTSHSVVYHADTVFSISFDDAPLDIIWDDPDKQGVQWDSKAAQQAAETTTWVPPHQVAGITGVPAGPELN